MSLAQSVTPASPQPSPAPGRNIPSPGVLVCSPNASARPRLEAFIQDAFRRKHGAAVRSFMPILIGLNDGANSLVGAAGYRNAGADRLYLEQYLDRPIESVIAARHPGSAIPRAAIAEIGNFACRDCATAMLMVGVLAEFLLDQRHRWVVFTATRTVRRIMRHLGLVLTDLARADKTRVVVTDDHWGAYYTHDPRVMLGHIADWRDATRRQFSR